MSDRRRVLSAAIEAVVGAVVFVGGALMAQVVALLVPWGCLLLVLGGIAVVHGVLVGLRVEEPLFGRKRGDEDGD